MLDGPIYELTTTFASKQKKKKSWCSDVSNVTEYVENFLNSNPKIWEMLEGEDAEVAGCVFFPNVENGNEEEQEKDEQAKTNVI